MNFQYKNIESDSLKQELITIIQNNITQHIIPGVNYIPVTGKVLDVDDILHGVDATLDAWLTAGRYSKDLERELDRKKQDICEKSKLNTNLNLIADYNNGSIKETLV